MTATSSRTRIGRSAFAPCTILALFALTALSGCRMPHFDALDSVSDLMPPPPSQWIGRLDGSRLIGGGERDEDRAGISDVFGPLQRRAISQSMRRSDSGASDVLEEAHRLYEANDFESAERAFARIAEKRDTRKSRIFSNEDGLLNRLFTRSGSKDKRLEYDPVREEAVFYLAESRFQQGRLPKASETYKALMKDYPSSRYLDQSSRRLFKIAQTWLGVDDFVTTSEIRNVSFSEEDRAIPLSNIEPQKKSMLPNFRDKSRPVFDTTGQALNSLRSIWINDPSGDLADDAIMLAATYNLRKENYRESARLMKLIREQFPKSPHLQNAFVVGSHVELMSYQGPKYDEQRLDEAYELKENALRLFPDAAEADSLRNDLKHLYNARAKREWENALFWEKKEKPEAVAVYCRELLRLYPNSEYASLARQKLAELGGMKQIGPEADYAQPQPDEAYQPFQSVPEVPEGPVFESGGPIYDGA